MGLRAPPCGLSGAHAHHPSFVKNIQAVDPVIRYAVTIVKNIKTSYPRRVEDRATTKHLISSLAQDSLHFRQNRVLQRRTSTVTASFLAFALALCHGFLDV